MVTELVQHRGAVAMPCRGAQHKHVDCRRPLGRRERLAEAVTYSG